jgi:ASC-1-like (ASCH) protein
MAETFTPMERYEFDHYQGAPIRWIASNWIADVVAGKWTFDIVRQKAPITEGTVIQMYATDRTDMRALVIATNVIEYDTYEKARVALGENLGPWSTSSDNQVGAGRVKVYNLTTPKYAHAIPPIIPPPLPDMVLYDACHLRGSNGSIGVVSVHSTDLKDLRRIVSAPRTNYEINEAARNNAQKGIIEASTTVMANIADARGNVLGTRSYTFSSAPVIVYTTAEKLQEDPEYLTSDSGIRIPWKKNGVLVPVIATAGREAIRVLIYRIFDNLVVVYERQIVILPFVVSSEKKIISELVICSIEITIKIMEAAANLLREDGEAALIGVYTSHTGCVTFNETSGWFVIQGNIPKDRVLDAYRTLKMTNLAFGNRAEVIEYMLRNWRNFVHFRLQDGSQIVVYNTKMRMANRVAILPLQLRPSKDGEMRGIELSKCSEHGANYLTRSMLEAASDAINECTRHATLQELRDTATRSTNPLQGCKPLFFDHEGQLRFPKLMEIIHSNFHELTVENGTVLQIDSDFMNAVDAVEPQLIKHNNAVGGVRSLVLDHGKTGSDIYEAFMERFVRAFITTMYVCYGHGCDVNNTKSLVHMIYRAGMSMIQRRGRIFTLLSEGYDWLETDVPRFSEAFLKVWTIAKEHVQSHDRARSRDHVRSQDHLHKNLLIGYIMNRPNEQFVELEQYLTYSVTQWIMTKSMKNLSELQREERTIPTPPYQRASQRQCVAEHQRAPEHQPPPRYDATATQPRQVSTKYIPRPYMRNATSAPTSAPAPALAPVPTATSTLTQGTENVLSAAIGKAIQAKVQKPLQIKIMRKYFDSVANGSKTVEGRISSGPYKDIRAGQTVEFICDDSRILCSVKASIFYGSFKEMLEKEGVMRCLPETTTVEEGLAIYHSFEGYEKRSKDYGVRAIRIERLGIGSASDRPVAAAATAAAAPRPAPTSVARPAAALKEEPTLRPIKAEDLIKMTPEEQKNALGERLYYGVQMLCGSYAPKVTGMMLEQDVPELLHLLDDNAYLNSKVVELVEILKRHGQ